MREEIFDVGVGLALNNITNNLNVLSSNILQTSQSVVNIDSNLKVVYDEVEKLAREFHDYVKVTESQHNISLAETRLVKVRQELETKYGYHAQTRHTVIGVLQANDLELVRKDTITMATEELMLSAPGYWLTPALVALAAWINDNKELADRAVREAIRRNDEKTSLLFALICRRADRKSSSLKWVHRYLANQNEEELDRKAVIVLDAFASGLLGADTEGVVARQLDEWITHLQNKPGFVEKQTKQWSEAIELMRKPFSGGFTYLQKYSKTWPKLQHIMEGAFLHADLLAYFEDIFNRHSSGSALEEQLDDILTNLVTEFDDEELPLRKSEKFNQLVIAYDGDLLRAQKSMKAEEVAFDTRKDFTQLLTDSAMKPEISNASASTQKFAIALSVGWIIDGYNDVIAKNRMEIPDSIEINMDNFNETTQDGKNEADLLAKWNRLMQNEWVNSLKNNKTNLFQKFCLIGGIVIGIIGITASVAGMIFPGLWMIVAGIGMIINYTTGKKAIGVHGKKATDYFRDKYEKGAQIIRATLAEVVDFRSQFAKKDAESQKVVDFLEQIKPEQYVKRLSGSTRRIKVGADAVGAGDAAGVAGAAGATVGTAEAVSAGATVAVAEGAAETAGATAATAGTAETPAAEAVGAAAPAATAVGTVAAVGESTQDSDQSQPLRMDFHLGTLSRPK